MLTTVNQAMTTRPIFFEEGCCFETCTQKLRELIDKIKEIFLSVLQTILPCFFKKAESLSPSRVTPPLPTNGTVPTPQPQPQQPLVPQPPQQQLGAQLEPQPQQPLVPPQQQQLGAQLEPQPQQPLVPPPQQQLGAQLEPQPQQPLVPPQQQLGAQLEPQPQVQPEGGGVQEKITQQGQEELDLLQQRSEEQQQAWQRLVEAPEPQQVQEEGNLQQQEDGFQNFLQNLEAENSLPREEEERPVERNQPVDLFLSDWEKMQDAWNAQQDSSQQSDPNDSGNLDDGFPLFENQPLAPQPAPVQPKTETTTKKTEGVHSTRKKKGKTPKPLHSSGDKGRYRKKV